MSRRTEGHDPATRARGLQATTFTHHSCHPLSYRGPRVRLEMCSPTANVDRRALLAGEVGHTGTPAHACVAAAISASTNSDQPGMTSSRRSSMIAKGVSDPPLVLASRTTAAAA